MSSRILLKADQRDWGDWRWQLKNRFKGLSGLKALEAYPPDAEDAYERLIRKYHFAASPYYLSLIDWDDPTDPIRRQVIPDLAELESDASCSTEDPFLEEEHSPVPGLIHRYRDRVLLLTTTLCAAYCRHCNRKRLWRKKAESALTGRYIMEGAMDYIKIHGEIREVILSGGDPLLLGESILDALLQGLRKIPHVEVIRIGTRVPVTLPMRIDLSLVTMLTRHRPIWINTHFNHPREITPEAQSAVERLITSGIPVCNQCVLLKGVNDDIHILKALFTGLQRICVKPYYLFHCDPVKGTDHFRTDLSKGMAIMEGLWGEIGGVCMPNYVVDLPQAGGKALLMPNHLLSMDGGEAVFRTQDGRILIYPFS